MILLSICIVLIILLIHYTIQENNVNMLHKNDVPSMLVCITTDNSKSCCEILNSLFQNSTYSKNIHVLILQNSNTHDNDDTYLRYCDYYNCNNQNIKIYRSNKKEKKYTLLSKYIHHEYILELDFVMFIDTNEQFKFVKNWDVNIYKQYKTLNNKTIITSSPNGFSPLFSYMPVRILKTIPIDKNYSDISYTKKLKKYGYNFEYIGNNVIEL